MSLLSLSTRQLNRVLKAYERAGLAGLAHKGRGRQSDIQKVEHLPFGCTVHKVDTLHPIVKDFLDTTHDVPQHGDKIEIIEPGDERLIAVYSTSRRRS